MLQHQALTHFAGFDWVRDHHDVIVVDLQGRIVADFKFDHTPAGWQLFREKIAHWPTLGVVLETSCGAAVERLRWRMRQKKGTASSASAISAKAEISPA